MTGFVGKLAVKALPKLGEALSEEAVKNGGRFATKIAPKLRSVSKGFDFGAATGGIGGGIGGAYDQIRDHDFDLSDLAGDIGGGALFGGLLGGGGGLKSAGLGRALGSAGGLGSALSHLLPELKLGDAEAQPGQVGSPQLPGLSNGIKSGGVLSIFDQAMAGGEKYPAYPTMDLADYMDNPRLNRIAQDEVNSELIPLAEQQRQMREDRATDLSNNRQLGQEIGSQMDYIGRTNADQTKVIQDAHAKEAQRVSDESHEAAVAAGANQLGNEYTNAETASNNAELSARLADRRMADSELLARLGVSGQEILGEMAAAEQMQTGQNATKIRTSYDDKISENAAAQNGVQAKKSGYLAQLAQGAFDSSIQKHQAGVSRWQNKLQMATGRANAAQADMQGQAAMAKIVGGAFDPRDAFAPSGQKAQGPGGAPIEFPYWINSQPMAQAAGIDEATWNYWQQLYQSTMSG